MYYNLTYGWFLMDKSGLCGQRRCYEADLEEENAICESHVFGDILRAFDRAALKRANAAPYEYICPLIKITVHSTAKTVEDVRHRLDGLFLCLDDVNHIQNFASMLADIASRSRSLMTSLHKVQHVADILASHGAVEAGHHLPNIFCRFLFVIALLLKV